MTVSEPLVDPAHAGRRRAADYFVIVKCGDVVTVHRFPTRDFADPHIAKVWKYREPDDSYPLHDDNDHELTRQMEKR
jgi:hypothetical protein